MKTYKALKIEDDVMDLVNIEDDTDTIMAAPDDFENGEVVTEEQIILKECNYVDEQGVGTGMFAFKK
jgi:hypothetical protein